MKAATRERRRARAAAKHTHGSSHVTPGLREPRSELQERRRSSGSEAPAVAAARAASLPQQAPQVYRLLKLADSEEPRGGGSTALQPSIVTCAAAHAPIVDEVAGPRPTSSSAFRVQELAAAASGASPAPGQVLAHTTTLDAGAGPTSGASSPMYWKLASGSEAVTMSQAELIDACSCALMADCTLHFLAKL